MDLQKANKAIKEAWIVGVISGTLTLIITVLAMAGIQLMNFSAWELGDVLLIYGFSFGIYRKSRTCATLLLIYFVASKITQFIDNPKTFGLMAIIVGYYYFRGIMGTFAYHKLNKVSPKVADVGE